MLVDQGSYGTSAVCMLEIAKSQLPTTSPLDQLQVKYLENGAIAGEGCRAIPESFRI